MSLRVRLALVLSLAVTLCLGVCGVASYQSVGRDLLSQVDRTLAQRATQVAGRLKPATLQGHPAARILRERPLRLSSAPEVYVDVVDLAGRVLASSANLDGTVLPLPRTFDRRFYQTILYHGRLWLRVGVFPVVRDHTEVAAVVVAESLNPVYAVLRRASVVMAAIGLGSLLVVNGVLWIFLKRGLTPLWRVATTAREIVRTGDTSKRVPVPPGSDEVVAVASSFNALVSRVQEVLGNQTRLLADTSHELRNPLTVVQTDLDMLGLELDAATRQEVAQEATRETARMSRLVQDLLLLSWTETGQRLSRESVDLNRLVGRVLERTAPAAAEPSLELDASEEVWVRADPLRLEQILVNLVENAVRHTGDRGSVRVRLEPGEHDVAVTVEDDGCGIDAEHLDRIFERFYRVDPSRSRQSGGTGLGLSVARALAEAHGGRLTVTSRPGHGSCFRLTLPYESRNA